MKNKNMQIEEISIDKIKSNPFQMREEIGKEPLQILINSIRDRGLFNPISLLKEGNEYIIVSGHRRLAAFKKLKKKTIPAIVKPRRKNGTELKIDLCHENLVREDLTPIEKALSIKLLISQIDSTKDDVDKMMSLIGVLKNYNRRGYIPEHRREQTQDFEDDDIFKLERILRSIGVSSNNAMTYLSLLALPQEIKKALCFNKKGKEFTEKISVKKAEHLARIKDQEYQMFVFKKALGKRATGKYVQAMADMYVKKVNAGEWKGFQKKANMCVFNKFKNELQKLEELSESSRKLSGNLASFRVDTLIKLEATIEKTLFISSMIDLKRELDTLRNRVNEKLRDKGYSEVKNNIDTFEVALSPMTNRDMLRFTFPANVRKELNLPMDKPTAIELKVVGIKTNKVNELKKIITTRSNKMKDRRCINCKKPISPQNKRGKCYGCIEKEREKFAKAKAKEIEIDKKDLVRESNFQEFGI